MQQLVPKTDSPETQRSPPDSSKRAATSSSSQSRRLKVHVGKYLAITADFRLILYLLYKLRQLTADAHEAIDLVVMARIRLIIPRLSQRFILDYNEVLEVLHLVFDSKENAVFQSCLTEIRLTDETDNACLLNPLPSLTYTEIFGLYLKVRGWLTTTNVKYSDLVTEVKDHSVLCLAIQFIPEDIYLNRSIYLNDFGWRTTEHVFMEFCYLRISQTFTYHLNVVAYDPDFKDTYRVDWFSKSAHIIRGGLIAIRPGSAAVNRGGVRITVNMRALTVMAHGNVVNFEQNVRRAANAITEELRFTVHPSNPISFRESSTAYIKEFRCTEDSTDWRADLATLTLQRDTASCGYCSSTHAGSLKITLPVPLSMCSMTSARWSSAQDKLVYWLAANGLPWLTTPVADPPMACLLDAVSVSANPVLFLFDNDGVIPVQSDISPIDVLVAIAACECDRQESQFVICTFIIASCIYNR
ncbi:hypothetical protein GJ496_006193 [Pomphorhynchus laevis]|nr:hypothetical protein GJ496_006193 [Pomphorhynchus laevis]